MPSIQYQINKKEREEKKALAKALREEIENEFYNALGDDKEIAKRVSDFLDLREEGKRPMISTRAAHGAINKILRYSDGGLRPLVLAVMDNAIAGGWESFYPLKDDEKAAALASAGAQQPMPQRKIDNSGVRFL